MQNTHHGLQFLVTAQKMIMHMACRSRRGAINKIQDKQVGALVYHNLRVLMDETDMAMFEALLQKTIEQLSASNTTRIPGIFFKILC